jgi:hypothetical protein
LFEDILPQQIHDLALRGASAAPNFLVGSVLALGNLKSKRIDIPQNHRIHSKFHGNPSDFPEVIW